MTLYQGGEGDRVALNLTRALRARPAAAGSPPPWPPPYHRFDSPCPRQRPRQRHSIRQLRRPRCAIRRRGAQVARDIQSATTRLNLSSRIGRGDGTLLAVPEAPVSRRSRFKPTKSMIQDGLEFRSAPPSDEVQKEPNGKKSAHERPRPPWAVGIRHPRKVIACRQVSGH